jgi:hypothetical protein
MSYRGKEGQFAENNQLCYSEPVRGVIITTTYQSSQTLEKFDKAPLLWSGEAKRVLAECEKIQNDS